MCASPPSPIRRNTHAVRTTGRGRSSPVVCFSRRSTLPRDGNRLENSNRKLSFFFFFFIFSNFFCRGSRLPHLVRSSGFLFRRPSRTSGRTRRRHTRRITYETPTRTPFSCFILFYYFVAYESSCDRNGVTAVLSPERVFSPRLEAISGHPAGHSGAVLFLSWNSLEERRADTAGPRCWSP